MSSRNFSADLKRSFESLNIPKYATKYNELLKSYQQETSCGRMDRSKRQKTCPRDREQQVTYDGDQMFGMTVYKMKLTKSKCFKKTGMNFKVSGFMKTDDYKTTLSKASVPLGIKVTDSCQLVIGNGLVTDLPLLHGSKWSLGGYMEELGYAKNFKRSFIGVYEKEALDESEDNDDSGITAAHVTHDDALNSGSKGCSSHSEIPSKGKACVIDLTADDKQDDKQDDAQAETQNSNSIEHKLADLIVPDKHIQRNEEIGKGTFGVVFKGMYLGTEVAIKVMEVVSDEMKINTLKEIEILRTLRHPNIVTLMGVCKMHTQIQIIMNYIDGLNLQQIIFQRLRELNGKQKLDIAIQVVKALTYMHGRDPSVIHHDIKPANIMVTENIHTYICDLGVAKLQYHLVTIHTSKGDGAGTLPYKAPEMFKASKRSTPADIYSLGCVFIEMFTEQHVWGDLDGTQIMAKVLGTHESLPEQPSCIHVPTQFQSICLRSTKIIPEERPKAEHILVELNS